MANSRQKKKQRKKTQVEGPLGLKPEDYYKKFSSSNADYKSNLKGTVTSVSNVTVETISSLFQNPETNSATIGSYMEALYKKNGIVSRTLNYLMAHPTYNHNLYLELTSDSGANVPSDSTEFIEAASYLEKYNIKYFAPYFIKQTLINGMSFFYEISDKKGFSYMEFPISMCRIHRIENGVFRWMIDTSKLKAEMVSYLPSEIVKAYQSTEKTDIKKWVDGKYYILSNKAVAFCFDMSVIKNGGLAISEFAPLLVDSVQVEKAKLNVDIKDNIDAVRIVHAKIPVDKDGRPTITADQASKWDSALKKNLPSGIVGITNPFELDNITLNGSGNSKAYSTVNDAESQLFYATGTSSALFGDNTTSSNIVKMSVLKDAAWIYTKVLPLLTNYYNEALTGFKSKSKVLWKINFIRQSYFTLDDDIKRYKDAITVGGSRTDYLASMGSSPLEIYSKLLMEQTMLNIDDIMVPKPTSFTLSGDQTENAGRPETSTPTDDTDRINDAS